MKFQGTHLVNPGSLIELNGVGERFNGKVFVSAIRHQIANGNWLSKNGTRPKKGEEERAKKVCCENNLGPQTGRRGWVGISDLRTLIRNGVCGVAGESSCTILGTLCGE